MLCSIVQHVFWVLRAFMLFWAVEILWLSGYWCVLEGDRKGSGWVGVLTDQRAHRQQVAALQTVMFHILKGTSSGSSLDWRFPG